MWRLRTFEEAATSVDEILAANVTGGNESDDDDESEDGDGRIARIDDDDGEAVSSTLLLGADRQTAAQNARLDDDDEDDKDSDDEDDDDVVVLREPKRDEFDEQAEAAFDRDFARMIADTTVERKAAPPVFDQAVPMFRKRQPGGGGGHGKAPASDNNMQFMLLSKKGNKPQVRSVDIPVDSTFASNVRTHQLASKAEQEQLKRLVLQNEQRQENEGLLAVQQSMRNRGINVRVLNSG